MRSTRKHCHLLDSSLNSLLEPEVIINQSTLPDGLHSQPQRFHEVDLAPG